MDNKRDSLRSFSNNILINTTHLLHMFVNKTVCICKTNRKNVPNTCPENVDNGSKDNNSWLNKPSHTQLMLLNNILAVNLKYHKYYKTTKINELWNYEYVKLQLFCVFIRIKTQSPPFWIIILATFAFW